jgi:hypothetical protein
MVPILLIIRVAACYTVIGYLPVWKVPCPLIRLLSEADALFNRSPDLYR